MAGDAIPPRLHVSSVRDGSQGSLGLETWRPHRQQSSGQNRPGSCAGEGEEGGLKLFVSVLQERSQSFRNRR